jgi:stage V sporulation protein G
MTMAPPIRVTGCRVFLNQSDDEHLKGFASVILNDEFAVCDLKIIMGHKGLFVAMPSRRRKDGTFHDVAHPILQTLRDHIETVVLDEYQKLQEMPPEELEASGLLEERL